MSQTTFSSLPPEIFRLIGSKLDQHSLSLCSLVNHAWHSLFESSLWRSLNPKSWFRCCNSPPILEALLRNIHSLRHLVTTESELLRLLAHDHFPQLANLQTMNLLFIERYSDNKPNLPIRLLTGCVNLESLTLFDQSCFQYARNEDYDAFQDILAAFPTRSLKKLSIEFEVEDYSPCVERGDWSPLFDHDDEYQLACERQRLLSPFVALRELVFLSAYVHIDPSKLEALMESVETLEELRIGGCGQLRKNAILDLLCSAKKLRRLESVADGERTEEIIELKLHAYEAYKEHFEGQMDREWALGPSVEFLQLKLLGVPRPDVWYNQCGGRLLDLNEGMDVALRFEVQQWIYTQLGRLTGVQELVLGITDFDQENLTNYGVDPALSAILDDTFEELLAEHDMHLFHYSSLEFSLKSGLGLLGGLKELRVLDVRKTAHRIGVDELEWMRKNWPKLEEVKGLMSERRWAVDRDDGLDVKAAVDAWMTAHPHGIGSSFYS
ncbi:hypothetical protein BKA57DRAFT_510671 [Linnemannia elongata]|nr:hypothetical protein BKA57DRAFT_510671 [Linnemannia elongata]